MAPAKKSVKTAAKTAAPTKAAPTKAVAKTAAPKTSAKTGAKTAAKRAPNASFMKALTPSADLAAIVGAAPLPRTEVVKKLWVYIKANNLQDPKNKRQINADAKLKPIFDGKKSVSMFEMTSLANKHLS